MKASEFARRREKKEDKRSLNAGRKKKVVASETQETTV
jgi:hypothetical protein